MSMYHSSIFIRFRLGTKVGKKTINRINLKNITIQGALQKQKHLEIMRYEDNPGCSICISLHNTHKHHRICN